MATTNYEPAGGLRTPPVGSRAQSAAAFHPAGPDSKPGRLHGGIEAGNRAIDPAEHEISFGPFRLLPTRRILLEGNEPVHLGSRALDLLIALHQWPTMPQPPLTPFGRTAMGNAWLRAAASIASVCLIPHATCCFSFVVLS
jgi:hypothetical protein